MADIVLHVRGGFIEHGLGLHYLNLTQVVVGSWFDFVLMIAVQESTVHT